MEIGKIHFSSYHSNDCWEEKCITKIMILIDTYYHQKYWLDRISSSQDNMSQSYKHNSLIFHDYLLQFFCENRNSLSQKDGKADFENYKCKSWCMLKPNEKCLRRKQITNYFRKNVPTDKKYSLRKMISCKIKF